MDAPAYQDVPPDEIPIVEMGNSSIRVIAGEYNGVPGAIFTKTPILLLDVRFKPSGSDIDSSPFIKIADSIPRNMNLMGYIYRGNMAFSDSPKKSYVDGTTLIFNHSNTTALSAVSSIMSSSESKSYLQAKSLVDSEIDDDGFTSRMLIIGGIPIKESIVKYGPFVMNTEEEINQAFEDYQNGKLAKKQIEGAAEELAKTRKAQMLQIQSGAWKKDNESMT